jgi:ATP-binding cassette subfamily F protein 3
VQQIDERIASLTAERSGLETKLSGGAMANGEIAEIGRRLNHILAEVAMLEERWLTLTGEIETINAAG